MGFLKKFTKKAGRVVTSKSKHTKKIIKVAVPIAAVGAGFMIGAPTLGALFASRFMGGNSEQSAAELPGETIDEYNARLGVFAPYGGFGGWAQQGLWKLGRSAVKRVQEAGGSPQGQAVGVAAGAGAATGGGACAAPLIVDVICKLCGGS